VEGSPRFVVLVEGESDRRAVLTLAARLGRDLDSEGVDVVSMSGVTNVRAFAGDLGPGGRGVPLAGLYDAPDEATVRRGLAAAGVGEPGDDPAEHGFFACTSDLEDELIRALGADAVEAVIETAGEGRSLRLLEQMPAQQGWSREAVLRRFLGVRSGRKARYAQLLVEALEIDRVPEPLSALLGRTRSTCERTSTVDTPSTSEETGEETREESSGRA
jgi:hypothetical protein